MQWGFKQRVVGGRHCTFIFWGKILLDLLFFAVSRVRPQTAIGIPDMLWFVAVVYRK